MDTFVSRGRLLFLGLPTLLGNEGVKHTHDLLLSGSGGVKPSTHLSEPIVDPGGPVRSPLPEVGQILAQRMEHARVLLAEIPNLAPNLGDVAVGATSLHASGCRILLAVTHALVFDSGSWPERSGWSPPG